MATTEDYSPTSTSLQQPSRRAFTVPLIVLAVVTVVLAIAWAGLGGAASGENTRRSFTPYDWSGSNSVGSTYDSPYPAAGIGR